MPGRWCRSMSVAASLAWALSAYLVSPSAAAAPFNSVWTAASGSVPDSACPVWSLAANDSVPRLTGGVLRVRTGACGQNALYVQSGVAVSMPDTVVVEARLRFGSGTECVGPCGHYRQGAGLAVTTANSVGVLFFVGNGEIFLTSAECGGTVSAAVATTDAAHTYRLVIRPGGAVTVFRDGVAALNGHTYTSTADHGASPRVLWGEGTSLAYGTSHWEWVKHNAHALGCGPAGAPLATPAALAVRAWPNPASGACRILWVQPRAGRVQLAVFDASGRLVRRLGDEARGAGVHAAEWDGRDEHGRRVAPGAYLCRVESAAATGGVRLVRVR